MIISSDYIELGLPCQRQVVLPITTPGNVPGFSDLADMLPSQKAIIPAVADGRGPLIRRQVASDRPHDRTPAEPTRAADTVRSE
jgi:hypothetical protein